MKEKIANVLKTILRVCIRIVVAIALIAFLVVPFLSNKIDHSIAQWIWYPAVSIYFVFAIIGCFNNKKQTFQDKLLDFIGKMGSILIIPVVVSIFVFNYYEINHIWLWVIFAMVLVFIPGALIAFLNFEIKYNNRTKEEIGIAAKNIIKYTFLFLLYDLTYMAIFNNWLLLTYTFGILSVSIILVGLARTFISGNKSLQFMLYIDLIIGVGLSIYLIYTIPDKFTNLQTIVTTIVAAIYGGLLTLVGVAWTIKDSNTKRAEDLQRIEYERKEEERKKHIPYLSKVVDTEVSNYLKVYRFEGEMFTVSIEELKDNKHYSVNIKNFIVKNLSSSIVIMRGININNKYHQFSAETMLEKNGCVSIEFVINSWSKCSDAISTIELCVADLLGNQYLLPCEHSLWRITPKREIVHTTGERFLLSPYEYHIESLSLPILQGEQK